MKTCILCLLLLIPACTDNGALSPDSRPPSDSGAGPDGRPDSGADGLAPVPFKPAGTTLSAASCLAHGLSTGSSSGATAWRTADLQWITGAGIRTLRADFLWHHIEKTKGALEFGEYDQRMAAAQAAGVGHIGLLAYGTPWASSLTTDDPFYPPDDPQDFAAYTKATVTRYKDKIKVWEVWNEPNAGFRFWKSHITGDPDGFGKLLKAAYQGIKAADPAAQVVFGGPFFHEQLIPGHLTFLEQVYKRHPDLGKYFDAMAIHPYPKYPPAAPPELDSSFEVSVGRMVHQVRELMSRHGDTQKPMDVTEVGWPVWQHVTSKQQARYLVRSYLLLLASGVRTVCWYTLRDMDSPGIPTEGTFGLLWRKAGSSDPADLKPKDAYTAYLTLLKHLGSFQMDADLRQLLSLPQTVHAYRLRDPLTGRQATALWSTSDLASAVSLAVSRSATAVTRVEMLGSTTELTPRGGMLQVTPGPDPVYLVEK